MLPDELFHSISLSVENARLRQLLYEAKFEQILASEIAEHVLNVHQSSNWTTSLTKNIDRILGIQDSDTSDNAFGILFVGLASLYAFIQANVTGPPLTWDLAILIHGNHLEPPQRRQTISSLSSDGEAAYHLAPLIELFYVARTLLNHHALPKEQPAFSWTRMTVNFWHQQLLDQTSQSLQTLIIQDMSYLDFVILGTTSSLSIDVKAMYLLEKASIDIFHGMDKKAAEDLTQASQLRGFEHVLTGRLGRRTKFQQFDTSQLVVLAKSASNAQNAADKPASASKTAQPEALELNDDTILEKISFIETAANGTTENVPTSLASLDPSNQPTLDALDSIILLSIASSITNTSPQHGLTREETLPYVTRVVEGGSTNWQLYTQALLVRSRIEGYKSRTIERGVLQLQALVDQVIAETSGLANESQTDATTFLPRPKASESATPIERLLYIDQLGSPLRWSLESELASRWVSLGGLRTALEIFERLEMWAEAALCWAATDKEDKARRIIRKQLYERSGHASEDEESEEYLGQEVVPLPADAPRLLCILGDIERNFKHYERAWNISNKRYARAQRSLGKYYMSIHELEQSDSAYSKALAISPQNAQTWFSLGCVRLETRNWPGAVDAFTRMVQLEQDDAEGWSNLAAALLRLTPEEDTLDEDGEVTKKGDPQKHVKEAFTALKRATTLKRESYRIWQNLLNVAATITPPPYSDLIFAQQRLIDLRADTEGEGCVDVEVMEGLLSHIIADRSDDPTRTRTKHGMENTFRQLVWKQIVPLITQSRRLWQLVARLAIFENKPSTALDAYEKAWRVTLNTPGWDDGTGSSSSASTSKAVTPEQAWREVVGSTLELVDAYESLGEKEVTEGLAVGSGELVCKNWKYKARMAIRSVIGRRMKAGYDDTDELKARAEDLK